MMCFVAEYYFYLIVFVHSLKNDINASDIEMNIRPFTTKEVKNQIENPSFSVDNPYHRSTVKQTSSLPVTLSSTSAAQGLPELSIANSRNRTQSFSKNAATADGTSSNRSPNRLSIPQGIMRKTKTKIL